MNAPVALISGASSGIGEATARRLAKEGYRVAITARREDRLQTLKAKIEAEGGHCMAVPADARDEAQLLAVFDAVRKAWSGVDAMVNNAGLGRAASLMDGSTEDWREMLEVNVLALMICTRETIKDLQRRDFDGHIIHIASMASHRVPPGEGAAYAATKHAVRALTEGLRQELRAADSGTRITSISPGFVETEFATNFSHGDPAAAFRTYGKFEVLQSSDIADMVAYALKAPPHVQIHDLLVRPTRQAR